MRTFAEYMEAASSEKLALATVEASVRLMGWTAEGPGLYSKPLLAAIIESVEIGGSALTRVESPNTGGQYSYDGLTLRIFALDHPNSVYVVLTQRFFFASSPVVLPHDLANGAEVFWEGSIRASSLFGVEMDTINQASEAIEGAGEISFANDQEFWKKNFDKLSFENKKVSIYSYNRDLDPDQAKLIFRGYVSKKSYSQAAVKLSLKDQISALASRIPLAPMSAVPGIYPESTANTLQRMILGRVLGHVPTNIDQATDDGYPVTGVVTFTKDSAAVTGVGTAFLAQLSPDDSLVYDGEEYSIASVASNTSLTLTQAYSGPTAPGVSTKVVADQPKRWQNRKWKVASHALREPVTIITKSVSVIAFHVVDSTDIRPGDTLYVGALGAGEVVTVQMVSGNRIQLVGSMNVLPAVGAQVRRPAVQNVRIDRVPLVYYRDYEFDATSAVLTLRQSAEASAAPIYQVNKNVTITNGSRAVTGSGFKGTIEPGYMIGLSTNATFLEVLSVEDDTNLTLRANATVGGTAFLRYRDLVYDPGASLLSMDVLGRTEDGTSGGALLATAPAISKALLSDIGLEDVIDSDSFDRGSDICPFSVGVVIPAGLSDTVTPTYREVMNQLNRSVLGSVVQDDDFKLIYCAIQPDKSPAALRFRESDCLDLKMDATGENIVSAVSVSYAPRESNFADETALESWVTKISDSATLVVKTKRTKEIETLLSDESAARILAGRWAFLLENSAGSIDIRSKLQGIRLQVGDVMILEHRKLFDRLGGIGTSRLLFVESVKKSAEGVEIGAVDLSNAFNRVASITGPDHPVYSDSSDEQKLFGGYFTDQYGLIGDDEVQTNLIW